MPAGQAIKPATAIQDLIIPNVELVVKGGPMASPEGIVYSTDPQLALDATGAKFCVKGGDDVGIVIAELLGHILAGFLHIPVPDFAVGRFSDTSPPLFASALVENAARDVEPWLKRGKLSNGGTLARLIALDVWIANWDRNFGSLLGRPAPASNNGQIELIAIDFEKAATVRKTAPTIEIAAMPLKSFWPRGTLGNHCKTKVKIADAGLADFAKITDGQIESAVKASFAGVRLDKPDWVDTIASVLIKRRNRIELIAQAEWN